MFFSQHLGKGNVGGKYDDGDDERIWHDTEEYAGLRNAERWQAKIKGATAQEDLLIFTHYLYW